MSKSAELDKIENASSEKGEKIVRPENELIETTEEILSNLRMEMIEKEVIRIPIAQLATLGAGAATLVPAFRTITQTSTADVQGLYRLVNADLGEVLKMAKDGNYWGALKRPNGTSKLVKLQNADSLTSVNTAVMPVNPAALMMTASLFSIEQKLDNIAEMEREILSFLETEKEAEIETDIETLFSIISKYKFNWENERFIANNHKLALDIQRTARKNLNMYQRKVSDTVKLKRPVVIQSKVNSVLKDLLKNFKYYRLSLYTYAMASLAEIMLGGNFNEEYITGIQTEIEGLSLRYREFFEQCSVFLEKISDSALETNMMRSLGNASKAVGNLIGSIPIVREGPVDEFLQESGDYIKENAEDLRTGVIETFAELGNPKTHTFIEQMKSMMQIYNHTTEICFDESQIYLITD